VRLRAWSRPASLEAIDEALVGRDLAMALVRDAA
jgi:hypothetical protein